MASSRKVLHQQQILFVIGSGSSGLTPNPNMSSTAVLISQPLPVSNIDQLAVYAKWTSGAPVGNFFLDCSPNAVLDVAQNVVNATSADWFPVSPITTTQNVYNVFNSAGSSTAVFSANGTTGWGMIETRATPQSTFRLRYVGIGSSGVLSAWADGYSG